MIKYTIFYQERRKKEEEGSVEDSKRAPIKESNKDRVRAGPEEGKKEGGAISVCFQCCVRIFWIRNGCPATGSLSPLSLSLSLPVLVSLLHDPCVSFFRKEECTAFLFKQQSSMSFRSLPTSSCIVFFILFSLWPFHFLISLSLFFHSSSSQKTSCLFQLFREHMVEPIYERFGQIFASKTYDFRPSSSTNGYLETSDHHTISRAKWNRRDFSRQYFVWVDDLII